MQGERKSNQKADEEERDTLTVSWCHLAQYLSSKGTGLLVYQACKHAIIQLVVAVVVGTVEKLKTVKIICYHVIFDKNY